MSEPKRVGRPPKYNQILPGDVYGILRVIGESDCIYEKKKRSSGKVTERLRRLVCECTLCGSRNEYSRGHMHHVSCGIAKRCRSCAEVRKGTKR